MARGNWHSILQCCCGIGSYKYLETALFQRVLNERANIRVVFYDENSWWHCGGWSHENHLLQVKSFSRTPEWVTRRNCWAAFWGGYEF
jgi:hypothetical protein